MSLCEFVSFVSREDERIGNLLLAVFYIDDWTISHRLVSTRLDSSRLDSNLSFYFAHTVLHVPPPAVVTFAPNNYPSNSNSNTNSSSSGELILSAGYDEVIRVWGCENDVDDEEVAEYFQLETSDPKVKEEKERERLKVGGGGGGTGDLGMRGQGGTIWDLAVTPSGGRIFAAGGMGVEGDDTADADTEIVVGEGEGEGEDVDAAGGSICIWESRLPPPQKNRTRKPYWIPVGRLGGVHGGRECYSVDVAGVSSGHGALVSGGGDGSLKIYREVCSDQLFPKFSVDVNVADAHGGRDINCVRWNQRFGSLLASVGDDGALRIWSFEF